MPAVAKNGIEGAGEFGVPVADEEAESLGALVQVHQQVPALLRHPCAGRGQMVPRMWTRRLAISITKNT
jgi:hypothetical protein